MRIALVVPHMFMQEKILPKVIFSPGYLALNLATTLAKLDQQVTLFSPGSVQTLLPENVDNQTADLTLFEQELAGRGYGYIELLKKHPLTFITLARQVQSELVAQAYQQANQGKFDLVHVWCNEEELALVMAQFCQKPVVFTHHEPFNFLLRYKSMFSKYANLNWVSLSFSQQKSLNLQLPKEKKANFVANVYHGLAKDDYFYEDSPVSGKNAYFLYFGRIIEPKGVHLAIQAAKQAGVKLKIAGKHYSGFAKDRYWEEVIKPQIDDKQIQYVGFIKDQVQKQQLLGGAMALLMPSTWEEPFGMVMIEALACGTPVIGFKQGAISEIIEDKKTGLLVDYALANEPKAVAQLAQAIVQIKTIDRHNCRKSFTKNFTLNKMTNNYVKVYQQLLQS